MKSGKISTIKKQASGSVDSMESSLQKKGLTRTPGTGVFKYPYKTLDGKYQTGLDPDASYIKRIQDDIERDLEIDRVTKLKTKLEKALDLDLSVHSKFWNYAFATSTHDSKHVQPVKLMDGDTYFDMSIPMQELAFAWLRVHPTIASSYQKWESGDYPAETQFYVVDDEIETAVIYKKKQLINKAIVKFDLMTPDKKKKVARLLGLPVTEESRETEVYNLVDNVLKLTEFKNGSHSGLDPVKVFTRFADLPEDLLHVKDLVKQAILNSIYRIKNGGKIYEGEYEVGKDEDDVVKHLMNEDHQEDLLTLEGKLKIKKLAAV